MKPLRIFTLLLIAFTSFSFTASSGLPEDFKKLLDRNKMSYIPAEGYAEVPVIANDQMEYEYAVKHKTVALEVRYAIRPMDNEITEYKKWLKNKPKGSTMINPDNLYEALFQTTLLNISGGNLPEIGPFPPAAVKSEFNADWGASSITTAHGGFAGKYKYCFAIALNKKGVGNAYIFFMANDQQLITDHFEEAFHSLKFK
ncbi:hypothetical protein ACLI1A_06965 [Flavobacterium sp. RHBU_3]|uniref:hypothetical protein n=1 Tax=Flavobacterium sp. RHBU_3 TaxID=3391184 RepID=UPI0039847544